MKNRELCRIIWESISLSSTWSPHPFFFKPVSFFVSQDLAALFEELQSEKKLKSHQKLSETLKNLLYCVYSCPSYITKGLMKVLQDTNNEVCVTQWAVSIAGDVSEDYFN